MIKIRLNIGLKLACCCIEIYYLIKHVASILLENDHLINNIDIKEALTAKIADSQK
jgi:hypothetical protein